jgi:N utilization substance protein A
MAQQVMKSGFMALLEQVAKERSIEVEAVVASIEAAIEAALRKDRPELFEEEVEGEEPTVVFFVELDRNEGSARIFRLPKDGEREDVTPAGFGRIAAQTAKNVIFQKVREAERDAMLANYRDRIGTLVQGTILRYDGRNAVVDLGRGQGLMPPEEQMRGEFYRPNLRVVVLIKDIRDTVRGEQVIVSRADKDLVIKLFEREVPEMASGAVEVKAIAREAGVRTKMAVFSDQAGVDPVGACVGQRGVRVQEVIRDANNEKIDIIQYSENINDYLKSALSPAESLVVEIDKKNLTAVVTAPSDQISLAVGRGGQNVRLAAKLTGYQITVQTAEGATEAHVTGAEEYEIDQLKGLDPEVRQMLIDERATTLEDLSRKWDTFQERHELAEDQVKLLGDALATFQVEFDERMAQKLV